MAIDIMFQRMTGCDTQMAVSLDTGLECPKPFHLAVVECQSGIARELMIEHFRRHFSTQLEAIRRVSYNAGWRAAKSKKPKRTWHPQSLTVLGWERTEAGE